jgi:hypothetical protein
MGNLWTRHAMTLVLSYSQIFERLNHIFVTERAENILAQKKEHEAIFGERCIALYSVFKNTPPISNTYYRRTAAYFFLFSFEFESCMYDILFSGLLVKIRCLVIK